MFNKKEQIEKHLLISNMQFEMIKDMQQDIKQLKKELKNVTDILYQDRVKECADQK